MAKAGVGERLLRKEDERFLYGRGRYVSDIALPGMLHAAFLRSPYAHARIRSIDVSRARALPGVLAVLTGRDAAELVGQEGDLLHIAVQKAAIPQLEALLAPPAPAQVAS